MQESSTTGSGKRILLIDVHCKNSSTGKIVYDLYQSVRADGNKAAVFYGRGPKVDEPDIRKFGLDPETGLHALLARITGYNGCFSFFSTRRLIRYIDAFKPDLIHIHELHAYFVNIKPLIEHIQKKNIPVVWTFHCEYMYTGKCGHAFECSGFLHECGNCPKLREYPKSLFLDQTKKMLRIKKKLLSSWNFTIAVPSRWLASRVKLSFLKEKPISVINNGVDLSLFSPGKRNFFKNEPFANKHILLGVADYWTESKGKDDFYQLATLLGDDYVCVLVGTEPQSKEGAPENVVFWGRINNKNDLANAYSSADLFVHLSTQETFGLVIAEAACCGTPVIGWNSTGVEEVLAMAEGYGIDPSDGIEAFARTITKLCSFSEPVRKTEAELNEIRNRFSNKKMLKSYLELYRTLTDGQKKE